MTFWVLALESRMTVSVFPEDVPAKSWTPVNAANNALQSLFISGEEQRKSSRFIQETQACGPKIFGPVGAPFRPRTRRRPRPRKGWLVCGLQFSQARPLTPATPTARRDLRTNQTLVS